MKTKMKFTKRFFSVLFIASLMMACSKDDGQDGATGPAGSQGEQGVAGQDGADGTQGEQGETGTANVIYSDWISTDFLLPGALESNLMGLEVFNATELNPVIDVVLVYGQRDTDSNADGIYPLPFILASQDEYYSFGLYDTTGGTSLRINVSTLDGGTNLFNFFQSFRYVIIPGGNADSGKSTSIDYGKMSYKEVVTHFNISD